MSLYMLKKGGINNSFNHKTLPFKVKLIGGRDWAFFKKWYVKYSIISFLKKAKSQSSYPQIGSYRKALFFIRKSIILH